MTGPLEDLHAAVVAAAAEIGTAKSEPTLERPRHARNGAYGDAIARLLAFHGHDVTREFYVNDFGSQVVRFAESLRARARGEEVPEGGYQGEYVVDVAQEIPDAADLELDELGRRGVAAMLERAKASLHAFGVEFDV